MHSALMAHALKAAEGKKLYTVSRKDQSRLEFPKAEKASQRATVGLCCLYDTTIDFRVTVSLFCLLHLVAGTGPLQSSAVLGIHLHP